jgi:hypothetical protein
MGVSRRRTSSPRTARGRSKKCALTSARS